MNTTYGNVQTLLDTYKNKRACCWNSDNTKTTFIFEVKGRYNERLWEESGKCMPKGIIGLKVQVNKSIEYFNKIVKDDILSVKEILQNKWEGTYCEYNDELVNSDKIPIKID